jgi:hypothetical protein
LTPVCTLARFRGCNWKRSAQSCRKRDFAIHYQPLSLSDWRLAGFEALVRSVITPWQFLPAFHFVAEDWSHRTHGRVGADACRFREWQIPR